MATEAELHLFDTEDYLQDRTMAELIDGVYHPTEEDQQRFSKWGINSERYLLLRSSRVKRHTLTKATYERFPDLRLASVFRDLDLKQQLLSADRVNLVGAANYILLVKKGTDEHQATQLEVNQTRQQFFQVAKLPVIISDHRLSVEIITPDNDYTLKKDRHELLDQKIARRVLNTFASVDGDQGAQMEARAVSRALENRRHMMRRHLENVVARAVWDNPNNAHFVARHPDGLPTLAFNPRNVKVDSDTALSTLIAQSYTMGDISRQSFLDYLGYDQTAEAARKTVESVKFDKIFNTTIPYNSPQNQGGRGSQGGRPDGGGDSPSSTNGIRSKTQSGASKKGDAS